MKYLTFLDYPTLEATGRSYEAKLKEKDREIEELKQCEKANADRIARLEAQLEQEDRLRSKVEQLTLEKSEVEQLREQAEEYKNIKSEMGRLQKMVFTIFDRYQQVKEEGDDLKVKQEKTDLARRWATGMNQLRNLIPNASDKKEQKVI
jgi:chromosome segregation ATPase